MGLLAPRLGWGRCAVVPGSFCNQQLVELRALDSATNFILAVGWTVASVVGHNSAVLQMFANAKAGVGLSARTWVLRRPGFNWSTSTTSLFVFWVPSEFNPAAPWNRLR